MRARVTKCRYSAPSILAAVKTRVKVGAKQDIDLLGRIVKLTKVETTMSMPGTGEITSTDYVDEQLRPLKSVMPMAGMNVEMVACTKEFAMSNNQPAEIIDKMFMASPQPIEDVGAAKSITYYLKPAAKQRFLQYHRATTRRFKQLEDGMVKVKVEPVSMPAGGTFPYKGTDPNIIECDKTEQISAKRRREDNRPCKTGGRRYEGFRRSGKKNRGFCVQVH